MRLQRMPSSQRIWLGELGVPFMAPAPWALWAAVAGWQQHQNALFPLQYCWMAL